MKLGSVLFYPNRVVKDLICYNNNSRFISKRKRLLWIKLRVKISLMVDLEKVKKPYFIGIGGIGISAIARMFLLERKRVSGSDRADSLVIKELREAGAKIFLDQKAENIPDGTDLVIYTIAIPEDNQEFMKAKELGIPMLTYPQALGLVSSQKYTIAVSGTHGKTTTTAMLAKIFIDAGLEPTVVVGSLLLDQKSNFIASSTPLGAGSHQYFITEACEYKRSFLNLEPKAVIITNIDADHLDYYKDLADIQSAFTELVAKIPADGFLICDPGDKNVKPILARVQCRVVDYTQENIGGLVLKQPGEHNIKDAKAALALAKTQGVSPSTALGALNKFSGTWRRFEYKGETKEGFKVYDDYAHHPAEIAATLSGARQLLLPGKKLIVAFQPHLFSRTKQLLPEFAASLAEADLVVMPDIYPAREIDDGTISSKDVIDLIQKKNKPAFYAPTFSEVEDLIKEKAEAGDMVITMGAGDVYQIASDLIGGKIKG